MSLAPPMRPAARPRSGSGAVRPHSAFPSRVAAAFPGPRRPRPCPDFRRFRASCASSLFLCPCPRPLGRQSIWWLANDQGQQGRGVVTVTALVTRVVTAKPLQSLDNPDPLPRYHRSHALRMTYTRDCHTYDLLSLVTWKQRYNSLILQGLEALPQPFPLVTTAAKWEHGRGGRRPIASSATDPNKIAGGYAAQQLHAGRAWRKFQAPGSAAELELAPVGQIGGFPPFSERLVGHVGTVLLEGSRQGLGGAAKSADRRKLRRLRDHPRQAPIGDLVAATPTPPNGAPPRRSVLRMDAPGISFELALGSVRDCSAPGLKKSAQSSEPRRGPGGAAWFFEGSLDRPAAKGEAGKRAGVIRRRPLFAQPHEAGEGRTLGWNFQTVKGTTQNV